MRIGKLKIVLLLLCCLALGFEIWRLRVGSSSVQQTASPAQKHKPEFVLLPESEVAAYARSFGDPKLHLDSWEPTVGDINDLGASLPQITVLSSKEPDPSRHVDHPEQYFRQYLAVVVNGKKTIFVNAMCSVDPDHKWRKQLAVTADGGNCHWHADYDPATQAFSNLVVNGRA